MTQSVDILLIVGPVNLESCPMIYMLPLELFATTSDSVGLESVFGVGAETENLTGNGVILECKNLKAIFSLLFIRFA